MAIELKVVSKKDALILNSIAFNCSVSLEKVATKPVLFESETGNRVRKCPRFNSDTLSGKLLHTIRLASSELKTEQKGLILHSSNMYKLV